MTYHNPITQKLVPELYHDETGNPIVLTPGQQEIFDIIAGRMYPRTWVGTYTQYGKSLSVGLGTLTRVSTFPEKWTIVAPKTDQAQIIMGYIIDHIFDNEAIARKFEIGPGESKERIRRERSKDRLTFRMANGAIGGVQILSAQNKNRKNVLDAILGFGSPNVIIDESSLLQDDIFSGILRMLGGTKDNFLMQIGNTIYRNHFYKASKNPRYHKVRVDYRQGIKEGRITREFIEETKEEMRPALFRMLYRVKFPDAEAVDKDGYSPYIIGSDIERASVDDAQLIGKPKMGIDVAGGGRNATVVVVRTANAAKVVFRTHERDHMVIGPKIVEKVRKYKIDASSIYIDNVGIGHGLWNYLQHEVGSAVNGVRAGDPAETENDPDPEIKGLQFENMRSLMYWRAVKWVQHGGKLVRDNGFDELEDMRWIVNREKQIKAKSKKDMAQEDGVESPDTADAFALTFAEPEKPERKAFKQKPYTPQTPYEGGETRPKTNVSNRLTKEDRSPMGRYAQPW